MSVSHMRCLDLSLFRGCSVMSLNNGRYWFIHRWHWIIDDRSIDKLITTITIFYYLANNFNNLFSVEFRIKQIIFVRYWYLYYIPNTNSRIFWTCFNRFIVHKTMWSTGSIWIPEPVQIFFYLKLPKSNWLFF